MTLAALALGSNLGDRRRHLEAAAELLDRAKGVEVIALSHLYESAPWGDTDQGPFLNSVLLVDVRIGAAELHQVTRSVEERLGKRVLRRWGPRTIDVDILFLGTESVQSPELTIPHPRIADRPFVLLPFNELAEDAGLPKVAPSPAGSAESAGSQRLPPSGIWPSHPRRVGPALLTSESEEQTLAIGMGLGQAARAGDVFAIDGPVGAGKSVLARGIARGMGIPGRIQSPTFALCREHSGGSALLRHWDFYRLGGRDDLESTGFGEDPDAVQVIEWAGMFRESLPRFLAISMIVEGPQRRSLRFAPAPGQLHLRVAMEDWPC